MKLISITVHHINPTFVLLQLPALFSDTRLSVDMAEILSSS